MTTENKNASSEKVTAIDVVVAGVPLRLRSHLERSYVEQLVAVVDQKIQAALPMTRTGSVQNAAILAALDLVEELQRLKIDTVSELKHLKSRVENVQSDLRQVRERFDQTPEKQSQFGEFHDGPSA